MQLKHQGSRRPPGLWKVVWIHTHVYMYMFELEHFLFLTHLYNHVTVYLAAWEKFGLISSLFFFYIGAPPQYSKNISKCIPEDYRIFPPLENNSWNCGIWNKVPFLPYTQGHLRTTSPWLSTCCPYEGALHSQDKSLECHQRLWRLVNPVHFVHQANTRSACSVGRWMGIQGTLNGWCRLQNFGRYPRTGNALERIFKWHRK